jgi:hypothetical protein
MAGVLGFRFEAVSLSLHFLHAFQYSFVVFCLSPGPSGRLQVRHGGGSAVGGCGEEAVAGEDDTDAPPVMSIAASRF